MPENKQNSVSGPANRVAIVCSGGGMRCVYSGGFLAGLLKRYPGFRPEIMVGSSGSAGNIAYYLSGQTKEIKRIWTEILPNSSFISLRRPSMVMDVDYLIDQVFKKMEPLDTSELNSSATRYFFPLINQNGEIFYAGKNSPWNIFEILRAAKAVPVVYRKKVHLGDEEYSDGASSADVEDHVRKAVNEGAKKVISIDTQFFLAIRKFLPKAWGGSEFVEEPDVNILRLAPTLSTSLISTNPYKLRSDFELGYREAWDNEEVRKIIEKP